jgi:hypothetical protein
MNTDNPETTLNNPANPTEQPTRLNLSSVIDWMRQEVRIQLSRGWLVAAGATAVVLLLIAID